MELRVLGRTGVRVSTLALGAMRLTGAGSGGVSDAIRVIHLALEHGINLIDTADVYGEGESETIVGLAVQGRRDEVVLATKFHGQAGPNANMKGNSRRWILQACELSLKRLKTDYIDLYLVHRPDPACEIDETVGALSDLVSAGKIRYGGTSTFPASQVVEAQWASARAHAPRFVAEQSPYSILTRGVETDVLPTCERLGIGVLVWSPLAGGILSGRRHEQSAAPIGSSSRLSSQQASAERRRAVLDSLVELAGEAGITLPQMALAWTLVHPAVTSTITGPRTWDNLQTLLLASDVSLGEDLLDQIDDLVVPGENLLEMQRWLYGLPVGDSPRDRRR